MRRDITCYDEKGNIFTGVITDQHQEKYDTPLIFIDGVLFLPFDLAVRGLVPHVLFPDLSEILMRGSYQHVREYENIYVEPLNVSEKPIYQVLNADHLSMSVDEATSYLGISPQRFYQLKQSKELEGLKNGGASRRSVELRKEENIRKNRKKVCGDCVHYEGGDSRVETKSGEVVAAGKCRLTKAMSNQVLENNKKCICQKKDKSSGYVPMPASLQCAPKPSAWSTLWGVKEE